MSFYRYIYYTILTVYRKFSNDPQIGIFALGFFSVLISFNIISIVAVYEYYIKQTYTFGGLYFVLIVIGVVLMFNTFYFLFNREKQDDYYNKFMERKSMISSLFVLMYIIFVFSLSIWIATKHREKNLDLKKQSSEIRDN